MAESVGSNGDIIIGQATVTTAGTAVQLSSTRRLARSLLIVAHDNNTGRIFVGGSDVDSSTHRGLLAGDSVAFNNPAKAYDLSTTYVDSTVNGEGVDYYMS